MKNNKYETRILIRFLLILFSFSCFENILYAQEKGEKPTKDSDTTDIISPPVIRSTSTYSGSFIPPDFVVTPPSPNAAQLGSFGAMQVGLFTGTAQYSVPIYLFETPNLSVPITLRYSSNGFKVDKLSSWVGYDWILDVGGVINRYKRGNVDERCSRPSYPDWYNMTDTQKENLCYQATCGNIIDLQPDIFAFHFINYSGKFVFDENGDPVIIPFQKLKIETNSTGLYTYFNITTPDGIIYKFMDNETTHPPTETYYSTSWCLTKIIHPAGDSVSFSYEDVSIRQYVGIVESASLEVATSGEMPLCPSNVYSKKVIYQDNTVKVLKEINFHQYGKITFEITADRTDAAGDYKLNRIVIKDRNSNPIKAFRFYYQFPKNNSSFPSKAPAGSFGPPHSNHHNYRMFLDSLQIQDRNYSRNSSYSFTYNSLSSLPARFSFAQDHWGYFNGKPNVFLAQLRAVDPYHQNTFSVYFTSNADRRANYLYSQKGMLNKITFPTGGYTTIEYEANKNSSGNQIGGCRVLRTKVYECPSVSPQINKYQYFNAVRFFDTIYYNTYTTNYSYEFGTGYYDGTCTMGVLSSNSINTLYIDGNYHVIYPRVKVLNGENMEKGKTQYYFDYNYDSATYPINGQQIIPIIYSNSGFKNGIQTNSYVYNNSLSLLQEEEVSLNKNEDRNCRKIRCMAFNKRDIPEIPGNASFRLQYYDVVPYNVNSEWSYVSNVEKTDYQSNGSIFQTTTYTYGDSVHAQITQKSFVNSVGQTIQEKYYYPHSYNNIENFSTLKSKFIVAKPIDIRSYNGSQLISGQQLKYNNNGQVTDIYNAEVSSGSSINFSMSNPYTFTHKVIYQYLSNSCVNKESPADDIDTYYLWDSSGKYLMAKIVGGTCSWANISSQNGKSYNYSSKSLMNSLKSLTSGSIITTYSYNVLVGLKEMTDPTGVTTFYFYDTSGRLSSVKNDDGKLLEMNHYNYYN